MKKTLFIFMVLALAIVSCVKDDAPLIKQEVGVISVTDNPEEASSDLVGLINCKRQDVDWFELADELKRISNCGGLARACRQGEEELSVTYTSVFNGGNLPVLAQYCSSGGCGTCAVMVPEAFTPADQDMLIAAAREFAEGLDHSCGSKAEYYFDFETVELLCGPCGETCNGNLIESNMALYFSVNVRCCVSNVVE